MTQEFDIAVVVGRFQPFHNGHSALLTRALELAPKVLVVLDSAFHARTAKNPFTWKERARMIASCLSPSDSSRVQFAPMRSTYDDTRQAQELLSLAQTYGYDGKCCALVGSANDVARQYLRTLACFHFVEVPSLTDCAARTLRSYLFENEPEGARCLSSPCVPEPILSALETFCRTPEWEHLREEYGAIEKARKTYGLGPFVTLDAVLTCNDHVLLIRRGRAPGKGLWALPGGFLEPTESLLCGAKRELYEETGLLLDETLDAAKINVFAHPLRSLRGRTITHAHYFPLGQREALPAVNGSDDAAAAQWVPLAQLPSMEESFFDDHFFILQHFLQQS